MFLIHSLWNTLYDKKLNNRHVNKILFRNRAWFPFFLGWTIVKCTNHLLPSVYLKIEYFMITVHITSDQTIVQRLLSDLLYNLYWVIMTADFVSIGLFLKTLQNLKCLKGLFFGLFIQFWFRNSNAFIRREKWVIFFIFFLF